MKNSRKLRAILLCVFLAVAVTAASLYSQTLRIYHIDVEQADATLFVSPSGQTMLVDCGRNGDGDRVKAVMDEAQASQVDVFVCTHYHADHYGGIDDLVNDYNVSVVKTYDRGNKNSTDGPTYMEYYNTVGKDADSLGPGDEITFDPAMQIKCISSNGMVIGEEYPNTCVNENDSSICMLITYGDFKYFIGGDVREETEGDIAGRDLVLDVDVYQANHHGSETSSSRPFMEDLSPTVIIISNGSHGTYHHPRQTTLNRYDSLQGPPDVFQTNKCLVGDPCGNVPDERIGDPESVDTDGTILVEVDNTANTYTVSLRGSVYGTYNIVTSVVENKSSHLPAEFTLGQNYPNPFNAITRIGFALPKRCFMRLEIYNILGERIRVLVSEELSTGYKAVTWDGKNSQGDDVSSGVYFYKIKAGDFVETKKMMLLK